MACGRRTLHQASVVVDILDKIGIFQRFQNRVAKFLGETKFWG